MRVQRLLFSLPFVFSPSIFAVEWKPISSEDRELKSPQLDPGADAEILSWDIYVSDTIRSLPYSEHTTIQYLRIKVFNERGAEARGKVTIPYTNLTKTTIADVRGRTIRPDGSIAELQSDQVFESVVAKFGKRTQVKSKTFSLPGVVPGAIIEYQWKEVQSEFLPRYVTVEMQQDIPARRVDLYLKPLQSEYFNARMNSYTFNGQNSPWETIKVQPDQWAHTFMQKVPALVDEPDSPSDQELKAWILIYYTNRSEADPRKYWISMGKELNSEFKKRVKVNDTIKQMAAEATAGATSPEDKLRRIADYCRAKIKNIFYETAGITAEDRSRFKHEEGFNSTDVAKQKIGYPSDINLLFAAMAQAQGFEVHGVRAGSARSGIFREDLLDPYLLKTEIVAVKVMNTWRYFNAGNPYLPGGMVDWDEEGQEGIILDDKEPLFTKISRGEPESSENRKLNNDGSIEGKVTITQTGHRGVVWKNRLESLSGAKRAQEIQDLLKDQHGEAEVTDLEILNVTDPLKPLTYSYRIRVPNYGKVTGKRVFFQPNFFHHSEAPRYPNKDRRYAVNFPYAFQDHDTVEISFPEGFNIENPEAPGRIGLGNAGEYTTEMLLKDGGRKLTLDRKLIWGRSGNLYFPKANYPAVKAAWDTINQADTHTMTLRQQ